MTVLIPTSLVMHNFWDFTPASPAHQIEFMNFIKVSEQAKQPRQQQQHQPAQLYRTASWPMPSNPFVQSSIRYTQLLSSCQAT